MVTLMCSVAAVIATGATPAPDGMLWLIVRMFHCVAGEDGEHLADYAGLVLQLHAEGDERTLAHIVKRARTELVFINALRLMSTRATACPTVCTSPVYQKLFASLTLIKISGRTSASTR